jgi:hypothetical protein
MPHCSTLFCLFYSIILSSPILLSSTSFRLPDVCDCYLELENTIDFLTAGHSPTQGPSSEQCNTDAPAAEWSEESAEALESKINAVIASCVQGSSEALHVLVPLVLGNINTAIAQLQIEPSTDTSDTSTQPATPSTDTGSETPTAPAPAPASASAAPCTDAWRTAALTALNKLSDPVVLGEKIKSLAKRTPYGIRAGAALVFENTDLLSLWRWEILR